MHGLVWHATRYSRPIDRRAERQIKENIDISAAIDPYLPDAPSAGLLTPGTRPGRSYGRRRHSTLDATSRAREADDAAQLAGGALRRRPPLKLDAGVELSPFQIAYQTYGTLNADAQQRGADLPCADRRPARRQRPSGHRQARLVGDHDRARQADRHRALLRHLPERARRLHGHDRAGLDQSEDRQAVGPRFSGHHHPRHGARAGDAARPARHRLAVRGRRRLDGRHAGAAMGGELSRARVLRRCRSPARRATRRRTSPSTRSAARR